MAENTYYTASLNNGSIHISEEVIVSLVKNAVDDSEDASLSNTVGAEIAELLSIRSSSKGVKVQFTETGITVDVVITVVYGKSIVETAKKVQENVLNELETLPQCSAVVNVHVSGITFNKE